MIPIFLDGVIKNNVLNQFTKIIIREQIHMSKKTTAIKTFETGGFQLQYCQDGKGLPAIVVGSAHYYPRTFSENIHQHLCFTYMDHRGFAPNPGRSLTQPEYELDVIIDDIEHLRQHLGLDQIVIIGHSGHGFMASWL